MRISDWSSDVCSSDLIGCKTKTPQLRGAGSGLPASTRQDVACAGRGYAPDGFFFPSSDCSEARTTSTSLGVTCTIRRGGPPTSRRTARPRRTAPTPVRDRKRAGEGTRVSVRVDRGGAGLYNKKKKKK